jgi:hypothetical protein
MIIAQSISVTSELHLFTRTIDTRVVHAVRSVELLDRYHNTRHL